MAVIFYLLFSYCCFSFAVYKFGDYSVADQILKARNNTEITSVKALIRRSFLSRLSNLMSSTNVLSDTILFLLFFF
jgi:ethanolamine utilization cobalamin adenosyltransferase